MQKYISLNVTHGLNMFSTNNKGYILIKLKGCIIKRESTLEMVGL